MRQVQVAQIRQHYQEHIAVYNVEQVVEFEQEEIREEQEKRVMSAVQLCNLQSVTFVNIESITQIHFCHNFQIQSLTHWFSLRKCKWKSKLLIFNNYFPPE